MILFQKKYQSMPWTLVNELSLCNVKGENGIQKLKDHGIEVVEGDSGDIEIAKNGINDAGPERSMSYSNEGPVILPNFYDSTVQLPFLGNFLGIDIEPSYIEAVCGYKIKNTFQARCTNCFDYEVDWRNKTHHMCLFTRIKSATHSDKYKRYNIYNIRQKVAETACNRYKNKFDFYGASLPMPCYRGEINDDREFHYCKLDKMASYNFNICLENSRFNGYVTEKITHSLIARCIPIYIGAPDVSNYIPKELFIDISNYKNIGECFDYVDSLSPKDIAEWISKIDDFVTDEKNSYQLDSLRWADEIIRFVNSL
jgi:hypothetical protein